MCTGKVSEPSSAQKLGCRNNAVLQALNLPAMLLIRGGQPAYFTQKPVMKTIQI
jgi:hypothetical protein